MQDSSGAGPRSTESVSLPLRKKILFGVIVTVLGLGLVELVSLILLNVLGFAGEYEAVMSNQYDPAQREVVMKGEEGMEMKSLMDDTMDFNLFRNRTTQPDARYIFRVRQGAYQDDYAQKLIKINADGFRGADFDLKDENGPRIMLLGDSCLFGWGVFNERETISGFLRFILELELGPAQIFNLGQPGFSTYQCTLLFDDWFDRIRPDYLIYYGGWNDLHEAKLTDEQMHQILRWTMSPSIGFVRHSKTYELLSGLTRKVRWARLKEEGQIGPARRRVATEDAVNYLRDIISRAKESGCRVLIALPPFSAMRGPDTPGGFGNMLQYREKLTAALGGDARIVQFAELEYSQPESPQYFLETDGYHPNPAGSKVIALELARAIAGMERTQTGGSSPDSR